MSGMNSTTSLGGALLTGLRQTGHLAAAAACPSTRVLSCLLTLSLSLSLHRG